MRSMQIMSDVRFTFFSVWFLENFSILKFYIKKILVTKLSITKILFVISLIFYHKNLSTYFCRITKNLLYHKKMLLIDKFFVISRNFCDITKIYITKNLMDLKEFFFALINLRPNLFDYLYLAEIDACILLCQTSKFQAFQ